MISTIAPAAMYFSKVWIVGSESKIETTERDDDPETEPETEPDELEEDIEEEELEDEECDPDPPETCPNPNPPGPALIEFATPEPAALKLKDPALWAMAPNLFKTSRP